MGSGKVRTLKQNQRVQLAHFIQGSRIQDSRGINQTEVQGRNLMLRGRFQRSSRGITVDYQGERSNLQVFGAKDLRVGHGTQ